MKSNENEIVVKNASNFEGLIKQALNSPRKRALHMLHSSHEAELHSMINVFTQGSYAAPHTHWIKKSNGEIIKKGESFLALEGRGKIIIFDQKGNLQKTIDLDSEQKTMVWIPSGVWNTILATSPVFIVFENKTGPWREGEDKLFHPEFPAENTPEGEDLVKKWKDL